MNRFEFVLGFFFLLGLGDQHQVPNIPCDRADQDIFLFHHLTYFHKLNAKAATKIIRALLLNKNPSEPLFHYNDNIIVSNQPLNNQSTRRIKKLTNNQEKSNQCNYFTQSNSNSYENISSNINSNARLKVSRNELYLDRDNLLLIFSILIFSIL